MNIMNSIVEAFLVTDEEEDVLEPMTDGDDEAEEETDEAEDDDDEDSDDDAEEGDDND